MRRGWWAEREAAPAQRRASEEGGDLQAQIDDPIFAWSLPATQSISDHFRGRLRGKGGRRRSFRFIAVERRAPAL